MGSVNSHADDKDDDDNDDWPCVRRCRRLYRASVVSCCTLLLLLTTAGFVDMEESAFASSWSSLGVGTRTTRVGGENGTRHGNGNGNGNGERRHGDGPASVHRDMECEWSGRNDTGCTELLARRLPRHSNATRWAFFGDSTMKKLTRHVFERLHRGQHSCRCATKTSTRCDIYRIYNLEPSAEWTPPESGTAGPVLFGLLHPRCQDCMGCNSVLNECAVVPCADPTASYFSVEFARDVEIQTNRSGTTQESLALYLATTDGGNSAAQRFVCVANAGAHDLAIPNASLAILADNVAWYVRLLSPHCSHLFWMQCTATLDEPGRPQTNDQVKRFNSLVSTVLRTDEFASYVTIVDPFRATIHWPHMDNIHLHDSYYQSIATIFP